MAQQKVELRKVRDFSDTLNDTFAFIRENLKPLVGSFLGIAGIFLLSAAIFNGIYQSQTSGNFFDQIFSGRMRSGERMETVKFLPLTYLGVIVLAWLNYSAMTVVITAYMKLYEKNGKVAPTLEEVWAEFRKHFLLVALYTIPIFLLMAVGFVLCLLPGIYLAVVLTPFPIIIMVENASFGTAFNRCFTIIKENFWVSLLVYFLTYLIYSFTSGIISLFVGGVAGLISYLTTKNVSATVGVVTSILNVFSFVFFIVFYVAVVLHYFNLAERFDGTGILRKLQGLGTDTIHPINNSEEEY